MDEISKLRESSDRWRAVIETKVNDNKKLLEAHHTTLYGNGKPGLDEEVRNINKQLEILIRLAWIVVTAVVTAVTVYLIRVI